MNVKLLPYVAAYLGGQIAGITLTAVIAKKVMPSKTTPRGPRNLELPADIRKALAI